MLKNSKHYEGAMKHSQDSLALDYLPALKALAFRLKERLPASIEFSDLISIGTEELIKLARRYDKTINDSFWGYARPRVHGAMLDYLRSLDNVSRHTRSLIRKIDMEITKYYNQYQEEPDNLYLSKILGEEEKKIKEARNAHDCYAILPIDEQLNIYQEDKTYNKIEKEELVESIEHILQKASKQEKLIIQLYYYEELTLKEISEILDLSESRISQIHKSLLRKIRQHLEQRGING